MKKIRKYAIAALGIALMATSCQKMDKPALGDYPEDVNVPGGPLKFYAAFDGTTDNPLKNAVDSIRANYPVDNPLTSIDGISGKAVKGENKKFLQYPKPNDWAAASKAFTISAWYRKDGQTKNNEGTNGPEYLMSFKSSNGHWSGGSMLFFLEGNNTACAVKVMVVDANMADAWWTWETADDMIPGLLDNQWHHIALVYNNTNSTVTLYIDGVANPKTREWGGHGDINFDDSKISEFRIGAGPGTEYDSDDWLSSSFKGDLDQVRMYSVALTGAEINELFTQRK
ncbi:MAG: LamG domain-containing protein [Chitinophagaceae bacterium]|nr:LamG domain-containing protein [Chitinophagaceae bacterium]